jgi:hypothetical protein
MVIEPAEHPAAPVRAEQFALGRWLGGVVSTPSVPSAYAWATTVAVPVLRAGAGWPARFAALAALGCLVSAVSLLSVRPREARWLGIYGFVGCCVLSWALLGAERLAFVRDPALGILGALGWAAFAFGWGAVRRLGSVPEEHPAALRGQPLPARAHLSSLALVASGIGGLGAGACVYLAWGIERPAHALFGHLVALAAAAGLLEQAGRIAVRRPDGASFARPKVRLESAGLSLALLGLVLAVGFVTSLLMRAG